LTTTNRWSSPAKHRKKYDGNSAAWRARPISPSRILWDTN
jgi:hypothetical protein